MGQREIHRRTSVVMSQCLQMMLMSFSRKQREQITRRSICKDDHARRKSKMIGTSTFEDGWNPRKQRNTLTNQQHENGIDVGAESKHYQSVKSAKREMISASASEKNSSRIYEYRQSNSFSPLLRHGSMTSVFTFSDFCWRQLTVAFSHSLLLSLSLAWSAYCSRM